MCQQSHNKCIEVTHWLKKHVCILREFLIFPGTVLYKTLESGNGTKMSAEK